MKKILLLLIPIVFASMSVFAGPPDYKQVAPAPTPCDYGGPGFYASIYGGANVYQSYNNNFDHTFANGDVVSLHLDHNVGGYGGLGFGYIFGNGKIRFAVEEDLFYNGVSTDGHFSLNGTEVAHSSNMINTGAFMTNFILRFPIGDGRFQPYIGAGPGAYYAETAGFDVTINRTGRTFSSGGGAHSGSFAFDALAGADYYVSCKWSVFAEYHFLEYVALDVGDGNHHFGQHLVGAGVRFHF